MKCKDFAKEHNLRNGTKEHNCGNCVNGYTSGMTAPDYYCKKANEELGDKRLIGYCYIDEKFPGNVCDVYVDENTISKPEPDYTESNMNMLRELCDMYDIPVEEGKKKLEAQGFDLSKDMCSQAIAMGRTINL